MPAIPGRLKTALPVLKPLDRRLRDARRSYTRRYRWRYHGRAVLEDVIFPAIRAEPALTKILFVGVDFYTADYPQRFADREFWTIDVLPERARFGAGRHVVGSITEAHFSPESFDAIVCVGVLGWGVDSPEDAEQAMRQCFDILRPGGLLVVGWNDTDRYRPRVPLDELAALRRFDRVAFGPFRAPTYPSFDAFGETFEFYAKPGA
jgi:SAM-dependent methyltransferase